MFIPAIDLGQVRDYTAFVVLEKIPQEKRPALYHCRKVQRFKRGTDYPTIVEEVVAFMRREDMRTSKLIIDGTGVGRGIVDMFRKPLGRRAVPVTITASGSPTLADDGYWHVSKVDLVGAVQATISTSRLKIAESLADVEVLTGELQGFQYKFTAAGNTVFGTWRENAHDDLVLAVALGTWWGEHGPKFPFAGIGIVQSAVKDPMSKLNQSSGSGKLASAWELAQTKK